MTYCSNALKNTSAAYATPMVYASKMPQVNYDFFKTNVAYAASSAPKIFTL
jgi:hypothetical protein